MNAGKLGAFATAHKKELMVGGAGVAIAFGLYSAKSKGGAGGGTAEPAGGAGAPRPSYGGAGYDSSSSDVYNALQPQIETTQHQLDTTQTLLEKVLEQLKLPVPTAVKAKPKLTAHQQHVAHVQHKARVAAQAKAKAKAKPKAKPKLTAHQQHLAHKAHVAAVARRTPAKAPRKAAASVYIARKGDTLATISNRLSLPGGAWSNIYAANRATLGPVGKPIVAGQRLVIPG